MEAVGSFHCNLLEVSKSGKLNGQDMLRTLGFQMLFVSMYCTCWTRLKMRIPSVDAVCSLRVA